MNATTATDFISTHKGSMILITLLDGTELVGEAFSVNSKGVNIKVDGKTKSVSISRIGDLDLEGLEDDEVADEVDEDEEAFMDEAEAADDLEEIYALLTDGMTTADLADALADHLKITLTPKELRVHLRALGLGVGKGRKYALSASEFRAVKALIVADAG